MKCHKLPSTATKAELAAARKEKMMSKYFKRYETGERRPETPQERERRLKAERRIK
jgi:hypothetical protein